MNDRRIQDASLEPHIPALMNLLEAFPDVNDRGQRVTVVDHEPVACEICGDPAVVEAQWVAASGNRGWSRVCCGPCGTRRGTIDAATHLMWLTLAGDVRARPFIVRAVQAGGWTLLTRPDSTGPLFAVRDRSGESVGVLFTEGGALERAIHDRLMSDGQMVHETTEVVADVLAWLGVDTTAAPDVPDEAGDRQTVVRAVQAGDWTLYTRPDSTGPLFAARDHERGTEYAGAIFAEDGTLKYASCGLLTKAGQEVHGTTTALADVLAWLGVDATAEVEPVDDRPSCRGCGTTVLAAVTVHPHRGPYLVEDQVRGLRQWLTAWCDGCAETELGDEPGWLVPEGADTATWPALAADTMAARLWDEVGVCFRCHDPAGRDGGEGDRGEGDRWRYPRAAAMVRRLSCGLRFRATTVGRRERGLWAGAVSLGALGELTAGWLTGQVGSQPGYYGPVDVDEDQAPGLTAALVALNRAGVCTRNSQAGYMGCGADGALWVQHAAVTGYADTEAWYRLLQAMDGTGYQVLAHVVRRRRRRARPGVVVTWRDGQPYTEFGAQLTAGQVRFDLAGAGRTAVAAAVNALQVTVWDPTPGANTLWAHLAGEQTAGVALKATEVDR